MDIAKFTSIALISLLGAISPGPDFAMVTKNSLAGTFRTGFLTSLGVASALLIHVSYCIFGIAILIAQTPVLFQILKYLGAAYLIYLGIVLLCEKKSQPEGPEGKSDEMKTRIKKRHSPFIAGFLCNLLNPKATLFMLSIFTQFIDPSMNVGGKIILGSIVPLVTFAWFVALSYFITHRLLQKHFARFQYVITKGMGIILCLLAVYVIIT